MKHIDNVTDLQNVQVGERILINWKREGSPEISEGNYRHHGELNKETKEGSSYQQGIFITRTNPQSKSESELIGINEDGSIGSRMMRSAYEGSEKKLTKQEMEEYFK